MASFTVEKKAFYQQQQIILKRACLFVCVKKRYNKPIFRFLSLSFLFIDICIANERLIIQGCIRKCTKNCVSCLMKGHTFFFSSSPPFTEKTPLLQSWMSVRDLSIESNWPCKWYASSCAEQRTTSDNFLIVSRKGISNTHRVPFHWIKF